MTITPKQAVAGLKHLFPNATWGPNGTCGVYVVGGVVTHITSPTPVTEAELLTAAENAAPLVPQSLTAWQAKAALKLTPHPQAGDMLTAAEAAISAMPDGAEKVVILSAWANNANFLRSSPTILAFGQALGMNAGDLDNLFRLGGGLKV